MTQQSKPFSRPDNYNAQDTPTPNCERRTGEVQVHVVAVHKPRLWKLPFHLMNEQNLTRQRIKNRQRKEWVECFL